MLVGIFGTEDDAQSQKLNLELEYRGAEVLLVDAQAPLKSMPVSFDGYSFYYGKRNTADVGVWFMRHILMSMPDVFFKDERFQLFKDWHTTFMRRREWIGFQMSWLLTEALCRGIPVINPPVHGGILQHKPYQLARARQLGFLIPDTLVSNDPDKVREFVARHRYVVYKPTMGGGLCQLLSEQDLIHLEQIRVSPVTFQEAALGICLRVTLLDDEVLSVVAIPSETIDYRQDPDYLANQVSFIPQRLPDKVVTQLKALMKALNLVFAGIDLILKPNGDYVFLEANPSPIYLEIENQTGHPISAKIAEKLLSYVSAPPELHYQLGLSPQLPGLIRYTNPFDPAGLPWAD